MYYYECPNCGAHLDPGERCDCTKEKAAPSAGTDESGDLVELALSLKQYDCSIAGVVRQIGGTAMSINAEQKEQFVTWFVDTLTRQHIDKHGEPDINKLSFWKITANFITEMWNLGEESGASGLEPMSLDELIAASLSGQGAEGQMITMAVAASKLAHDGYMRAYELTASRAQQSTGGYKALPGNDR